MTYYVGLDIAKFKHDCFIMDSNGEVIRESFSFKNDSEGFNQLLDVLNALDQSSKIKIGLEATGHYATNLKIFLEENNFSYMEFHPLFIKRFSLATTLRRTKTDKVDAQLIALFLSTADYKPYLNKSYHIYSLKLLTRNRDKLVKERSLQLVRMTNMLDLIFPEFKPFFDNKLNSATALYILSNYTTPSKISKMTIDSFNKMKSKLRRTISYARFLELKQLAKQSIGNQDPLLVFQLESYLEFFKELDSKIDFFDQHIESEFKQIHTHILSIPGIGLTSAASIFAEIGNIARFSSASKLLAFAGLEPSTIQSGEAQHSGKMVKHGSSHLRFVLMNVAEYSLIHNPVLYEYYLKKKREGKPHRVALSHVAKKIVRIIYHLETHDIDFDSSKLR